MYGHYIFKNKAIQIIKIISISAKKFYPFLKFLCVLVFFTDCACETTENCALLLAATAAGEEERALCGGVFRKLIGREVAPKKQTNPP